jgi:hypothetical protein
MNIALMVMRLPVSYALICVVEDVLAVCAFLIVLIFFSNKRDG